MYVIISSSDFGVQDAFIGFGGNQIRQIVKEKAKWFVTDFMVLCKALDKEE
jgi:phosphoserine phosphatase